MPARKKTSRGAKSAGSIRRHKVSAALTVPELTKAGTSITLYIHRDDVKLGELDIGRGAVYWRGGNKQKWERIQWTRFATMLNELAYGKSS